MDQTTLIDRVRDRVRIEPAFRGLFLAGSFANGTADAFSDVDFCAVAAPHALPDCATLWREDKLD